MEKGGQRNRKKGKEEDCNGKRYKDKKKEREIRL
jgi:hypothetical protein